MKILFIAPLNSIHSVRWISYFIHKGYDVHVLSFSEQLIDLDGATVIIMKPNRAGRSRLPYYFTYYQSLRKIADSIRPDLIHIHWIDKLPYLTVMNKPYPVMVTAWGSDVLIEPLKSLTAKFFLKRLLQRAQIITTDGLHMKSELLSLRFTGNKIRMINFGTELNDFNPSKRVNHISTELGFKDDIHLLVISIRALEPIYDIAAFVRAIPLVIKEVPQIGFIVVGEGKEKHSLELLSKKLEIEEYVRFVGRLSNAELQKFLASSDIYVSTSLSDAGLASSTSEAMASGLPVIISDFGDNRRWVKDLKTGLLFPCSDHRSLAEKIIFLVNNKKISARIARNGRALIEKTNNYHVEMEKIDRLYHGIANKGFTY